MKATDIIAYPPKSFTFKPEGCRAISVLLLATIDFFIQENSIQNNYDDFYVGSLSYALPIAIAQYPKYLV